MRIGLISDTHVPVAIRELPRQVGEALAGVDLILHAGDIYDMVVLDELEKVAPVLAALGDDDGDYAARDRRVKEKHTLHLDGLTLWLTHKLPRWNLQPGPPGALPDIVVCGHTHKAYVGTDQGVLLVNPGSATFPWYRKELGTVAFLTILEGKAEAELVQLGE